MLPAAPAPDVPVAELHTRLNTLRREMARQDLGFLVLTGCKNIEYLTDYKSLSWGYHSRPLFVVVDHDDVIAVANRTETRNLESKPRQFDHAEKIATQFGVSSSYSTERRIGKPVVSILYVVLENEQERRRTFSEATAWVDGSIRRGYAALRLQC